MMIDSVVYVKTPLAAEYNTTALQKAPIGASCNTVVLHLATTCLYITIICSY